MSVALSPNIRWFASLQAGLLAIALLLAVAPRAQAEPTATPPTAATAQTAGEAEVLWYFWRDHCPFCREAADWLDQLEAERPGLAVRRVEVVRDPAGRARFLAMMAERGETPRAVPTFILGGDVWVGFSPAIAETLEARLAAAEAAGIEAEDNRWRLDLGPLGRIDLAGESMLFATLLIAFVDGFNPCSIWVLSVLLAMILGSGSRARTAAVGGTFLLVTASLYGLFIAGLFAALSVARHLAGIQLAVALFALVFGAVNVKDYFALHRGISFSIPERFKPRIYRGSREVRRERPLPMTLLVTVVLAGGVALVELPCTAGFPVVWTSLLAEAGVEGIAFAGLLAVYLLVYLAIEIVILTVAIATLSIGRMQESHGRKLKLVGGMVMLALGGIMLVAPELMESLTGSLAVIGLALAGALGIMAASRLCAKG
ncbi:glutaredoxin family protein [Halomonas sp.]|uniref:glutaredoxin family protein n=1 Tax=Halomonas sp. TaxID=1486246 RepID=UPI0025C2E1F1|nr:glutaredoxin family protein [Halomonas sp.]